MAKCCLCKKHKLEGIGRTEKKNIPILVCPECDGRQLIEIARKQPG